MNLKKLGIILLGALMITGCGQSKNEKIDIGIRQILPQAALEATVEGYKQAHEDKGYGEDKINIEYQNAQGDFGSAQTIAR